MVLRSFLADNTYEFQVPLVGAFKGLVQCFSMQQVVMKKCFLLKL